MLNETFSVIFKHHALYRSLHWFFCQIAISTNKLTLGGLIDRGRVVLPLYLNFFDAPWWYYNIWKLTFNICLGSRPLTWWIMLRLPTFFLLSVNDWQNQWWTWQFTLHLSLHTVRNLHFLSKNSTLIFWTIFDIRFLVEKFNYLILFWLKYF